MGFKMTYDKRNRDNLAKLADHTKAAAAAWYDFLIKNEIDVLIYETIRTKAKQAEYVKSGASQTMTSYHLVGQALDFVPVNAKGETLWGGYGTAEIKKAVAEAKRLGFEWGGDWKNFVDKPHLQFNHTGYGKDTFGKVVAAPKPVVTPKPAAKPIVTATKPPVKKPAAKPAAPKQVGKIQIVGVKYAAYIVEKPSTNGKVLATVNVGGVLPISGSVKGWFEVIYKGERAYVNAKYGKRV